MNERCFAYREEKHKGTVVEWTEKKCDCLEESMCNWGVCRFFKDKDDVEMYVEKKQVRYKDL